MEFHTVLNLSQKEMIPMNNRDSKMLEYINSNLNTIAYNQVLFFVQQKAMLEELHTISKTLEKAVTLMENQSTEK